MVTGTPTLQDKFLALETSVRDVVFERDDVIHTMMLALCARLHHYQLGVPGTAKSKAFTVLKSKIALQPTDVFEILMTRFTTPDEVNGTRDIPAMKEGRVKVITSGMAPEALLWRLDEIFKASSSILNSFLWALNEGLFRNDGKVIPLPLWSMFCASNELPEGEELNALYDRIHFRHEVHPIREPGTFVSMLKSQTKPTNGTMLDWSEVVQANAEVQQVAIPDEIFDALNQIRMDLRVLEIEPTDRRFADALKAIKAQAWYEGETVADIPHMSPLVHMLWDVPEQFVEVYKVISNLADPLDKEAAELLEEVEKLDSRLTRLLSEKDMDPLKKQKEGVEIHRASRSAKQDYKKLREATKNNKRKSAKVEDCRVRLLALTRRLLDGLFDELDIDDDSELDG